MIDLHCHLLPGLDDGPDSLGESLAMCRVAAADGIRTIIATPHYHPAVREFADGEISEAVCALRTAVEKEGIDITVLPGAEIAFSPEMPSQLDQNDSLTINGNGRYFLAEFSPMTVPVHWDRFLLSFLPSGMTPIIAHPERNAWFANHPDALERAVHNGILIQVTAMSITGGFGAAVQTCSLKLLRRNLVHLIASDGHSADLRPPKLAEAVSLAAELIGPERANALVTAHPRAIIAGRPLPYMEPLEYPEQSSDFKIGWFRRLRGQLANI